MLKLMRVTGLVTFSKYHLSFMEQVTDKRTKESFDISTVLCVCVGGCGRAGLGVCVCVWVCVKSRSMLGWF